MACDLLKFSATTFMALSVVNDLKVLMPPSLRFAMYLSFLEMVEGHQSIDMLNAHLVSLKAQMR